MYRDGAPIASGLGDNSYSDTDVVNNVTYVYAVSATYSDGEESGLSDTVEVTPQAQTVHEEYHDDGSAEESFNAGSEFYCSEIFSYRCRRRRGQIQVVSNGRWWCILFKNV